MSRLVNCLRFVWQRKENEWCYISILYAFVILRACQWPETWEEAQNRLLCNLYVLLFVKCILGVVQQLRGPNFTQLWPPQVDYCGHFPYYLPFFHVTKHVFSTDHLPTSSCPRSYWMTPQQSLLSWSELCLWGLGWSTLCFWLCVGEHSAYSNIFYQKSVLLSF